MREQELMENQLALQSIGVHDPIWFGLIPFSDEIVELEKFYEYDRVIMLGSTKMLKMRERGVLPHSAVVNYDPLAFDQAFYHKALGKLLLNSHAFFARFGTIRDVPVTAPVFIKPTRDLKAFAGTIVEEGQTPYAAIFGKSIQDSSFSDHPNDEQVLCATLVDGMEREYRNFVVDGKLITSSVYKIGAKITYERLTPSEVRDVTSFFNVVKLHYAPARNYVVDFVRMTDGSFKVIEYNCLNCAGMYACDRPKLFQALLNFYQR